MTAYFDEVARRLNALHEGEASEAYERLEAIEREVVRDVTLCAEWPGCPADIRDAIHHVVLRYAPSTYESGCVDVCEDYGDFAAHLRGIQTMCGHLHTWFHDLGNMNLDGFTDNPKRPLHELFGVGEKRRERMRAPKLTYWRKSINELYETVDDREAARGRIEQWVYEHALTTGKDESAALTLRLAAARELRREDSDEGA